MFWKTYKKQLSVLMMFIINGDKNETENEKYITKIQHK